MIALNKALEIIVSIPGRYAVGRSIPPEITQHVGLLERLRHHYEHIDERALGKVKGQVTPHAEEAWDFVSLVASRTLTDGRGALGIDAEATSLCLAARGYLIGAWTELVRRARVARGEEDPAGDPGVASEPSAS